MIVKIKKAGNTGTVYNVTDLCTKIGWSGTDRQCARKCEFAIAYNPLDGEFPSVTVDVGDIVYLSTNGGSCKFIGRITNAQSAATPGSRSYTAYDYMNLLLKSKSAYRFKKKTAEWIAAKVVKDAGLKAGTFVKTKVNIEKMLIESETPYNVIAGAYTKAHEKTGKLYRLYMDGMQVCVGEKNEDTGVKLTAKDSITGATLTKSTEGMINRVLIVNDSGKTIGEKEDGVNANSAAKALIKGLTKEASVEAVGDIRCTSGKSIVIADDATGLKGKFWITEDSHTWEGGAHKMQLKLAWEATMEEVQVKEASQERKTTAGGTAAQGTGKKADNGWFWPLGSFSCYISSGYGYRDARIGGNAFHGGTDITGANIYGQPVYASRGGKVVAAINGTTGYGRYVKLDHGDGFETIYGHCSKLCVKEDQWVNQGQKIAEVGSTGNSTGPHLHFDVRYKNAKKNPMDYVKKP